jgi:hypothetical protein
MEAMAESFHLIQQFAPHHLEGSAAELLGNDYWQFLLDQESFFARVTCPPSLNH